MIVKASISNDCYYSSIKENSDECFDINFHVNKYHNDESLILYRKHRRHLADSLKPFHRQAQALHIVPYPNHYATDEKAEEEENNDSYEGGRKTKKREEYYIKKANEEQIYNSWWNGYVLGYPEQFIDSYCRTFHNELSEESKIKLSHRAKRDIMVYFNGKRHINNTITQESLVKKDIIDRAAINIGLDNDISIMLSDNCAN